MKIAGFLNRVLVLLTAACSPIFVANASAAITIATVPVGNPGNPADPSTGFGSVAYNYNIGEYDVTAGQYAAFLNAVASTDTYGLWDFYMDANYACDISQNGSAGHYTYATTSDPDLPVNYVTWGDAASFCNWLTNGQPTGAEGNGTTETGSYTLNGATSDTALMAVTRNPNAESVIPTENEWYKAAYYNPTSGSYYLYPTQSDTVPSNVLSATGTNNANFYTGTYSNPGEYLTPVGAFAASPSAYGTFDQGGNVFQWNETVFLSGAVRGLQGGTWSEPANEMLSSYRYYSEPGSQLFSTVGFRVAQVVPEPATLGVVTLGVMGMLARRRGAQR
jgi:formylglycine-generating enzyme required for sulfatase activity